MPDFDAPGRYLRANYEREDWLAVVLIYRNPATLKQEFATAEKIASPQYQAHLRAANARRAAATRGSDQQHRLKECLPKHPSTD